MKLKDIMNLNTSPEPVICKKFEDFVNEYDPQTNSIEFDENGNIISNQLSVLNFIDFLLNEFDYLPESKTKKKSKKRRRKIIKNSSDAGGSYKIAASQDYNNEPYFNQPFSASQPASLEDVPDVDSEE